MSSISAGTATGTALVSTGDTTGALVLQVNGTTPSVTLAANGSIGVGSTPGYGTSGQVLTSAGTGSAPTWSTIASGLTLGTPVASTSGTAIDFTGIPAGVKQIYVSFKGVTISTTEIIIIQLGDSGGVEITGYAGSCFTVSAASTSNVTMAVISNGLGAYYATNSAADANGVVTLILENATSNTWTSTGILSQSNTNRFGGGAGSKSLSATLDRIRITTSSYTDTFTGGEINIAYA